MFGRRKRERELDRELQAHLDLEAGEGGDCYAARRALGNTGAIKEAVREVWGWTSLDELARNLRQAWRGLRQRPVFALTAILSLAVAIGANTAVFSLARGIVLKTLPVTGAERLVLIKQRNTAFHIDNCCFRYDVFQQIRTADSDFEDALAVDNREWTMIADGDSSKVQAEAVSGNYFRMLGVRSALGRLLDEGDETSGRVCVIDYDLWRRRFGGRDSVIGETVTLSGEPLRIVGVAMEGFRGTSLHHPTEVQVPAWMDEELLGPRSAWAMIVARLKPGVTHSQAGARLTALGRGIEQAVGMRIAPQDDFLILDGSQGYSSRKEQYANPVLVLFLLVGVVLLVACCNLAALLLVRSVERSREAGMRLAIGASRATLMRQFLTESIMLAAAGGVGGWFLSLVSGKILLAMLDPDSTGLALASGPDTAVFAFCLAITLVAGLVFGILPAWRAAHTDPLAALQGSRIANGRGSYSSRALIAAQIALSGALLFGAGLFTQTLRNLHSINLGFAPENLIMIHIDHGSSPQGAPAFFDELLGRVRQMPETRSASLTSIGSLSGTMLAFSLKIPGREGGIMPTTFADSVSGGALETLGIPLMAGRDFEAADSGATGEIPVIVNQEFARQFFAGDALGKIFSYAAQIRARVVGVAGIAKYRQVREDPQPMLYLPLRPARFASDMYLQLRSSQTPAAAIAQVRALVRTIDSGAVIDKASTMETQIDQSLARERMLALLSSVLGGISVFLAGIGLYGVLAFSVSRRTREIGIRMAVGADRRGILALVLREGAWMVAAGIAVGVPLALGCGRLAASLLYGLKPQDAVTVFGAVAVLATAALLAALLPAWRAARIEPMAALRNE